MKEVVNCVPQFTRVSRVRSDKFGIVILFGFDDSSMVMIGGKAKTTEIIR